MLIDGEKYACEACVRGHRVSNCQHHDRPLQHINKKGRPVSQCQHCRALRKSRATHIKCDCGEKTSKCAHLQQTVDGHKDTCCCNHGGRCTCSHMKDSILDTVPESDSDGEIPEVPSAARTKSVSRRRRANTVHSDGAVSFEQGGLHKPSSKHGRASSKSTPYTLSRVNSATSTSSMGNSTDNIMHKMSGRSRGGNPMEQRRVKSEAASPLMSPTNFRMNGNLPPLDLSSIEYPSYVQNSNTFDLFGSGFSADNEGPMFSAGLSSAPVDWSLYDLSDVNGESFAPSSYSQTGTQSYKGLFDFNNEQLPHLANTTSTSGEVSEVEDLMPGADGDFDGFGGSNSYLRATGLVPPSADISSIDYDSFYKGADSAGMAGAAVSMVEEDPAFWMPNYNATTEEPSDPMASGSLNNVWDM